MTQNTSSVEVSVLGHFQPSIIATKDVVNFTQQVLPFSKGNARELLNGMASASISATQRIFCGRNSYRYNFSFIIFFLAMPTAVLVGQMCGRMLSEDTYMYA